ncbi:hypothetical protein HPG69_006907 [Diceros bicornis minor]|uniref:Uncharacterized protein n=1 Tax=Diceros bicornis minor TaxID=77932 RepID=A0A7J7F2Q0_DICBM|nr:hypothetical protein HPG69_006907 [Diceros bicornis minor]
MHDSSVYKRSSLVNSRGSLTGNDDQLLNAVRARALWPPTAPVESKVFSGSSEKQQEAHVTLSAPPVEQKLVKDFLPDGCSSTSNSCQSSNLSGPAESQQQSFLKPSILVPGFLCPLQDLCTSPQEDNGVQVEREFPKGDYTCCDLVVKLKEYKKSEDPTMPEPEPAPPEPAPPEESQTPDLSEDCFQCQQMPASSLTLQEALEARKPQFISRSQERLKKLEHMVQQRKAQQKENLRQKQPLLPVRTSKKQFTIPHPLSGKLRAAWEGWRDWGILEDGPFTRGDGTNDTTDSRRTRVCSEYPNLSIRQPALGASPL